jgi:endonuclease YncB( thermonuclease family)
MAAAVSVGLLAGTLPVRAQSDCASAAGEPVWAERVVRGDEIVLVDGRRLRLAAAEAPRPPLSERHAAARRAAAEAARAARDALAERVEGREIAFTEVAIDRHGRRLGHLYDTDAGQWIDAALVEAGHLRVVPTAATRACAARLLEAEARARQARRGIWSVDGLAVAATSDLAGRIGDWVVAEGRVISVGRAGRRIWLNFGEDFRRDFAVVMDDKDLERFRAAGFDALAATGWTVRVRGAVVFQDGPRMMIEGPERIERVSR